MVQRCMIQKWLFCFTFASCLSASPMLAAEIDDACKSALLNSIDRSVDASSCAFLRMEDGRFAAIASDRGLFFRTNDGDGTLYTWLNISARSVTTLRDTQIPWTRPIKGRQTFPDAKSFYYPFSLNSNSDTINGSRGFCPDPQNFSAHTKAPCD